MILLLHIAVALISLVVAGTLFVKPSVGRIKASYWLVAATLATGTYLVVFAGAHLLQTCMSGLAYLAVVCASVYVARYRLRDDTER